MIHKDPIDEIQISSCHSRESGSPVALFLDSRLLGNDNQTSVRTEVTEGKGDVRDKVSVIGKVLLDNLPPRPKGTHLRVIYTYNRDKTLDVEVIDVETSNLTN